MIEETVEVEIESLLAAPGLERDDNTVGHVPF